MRWHPASAAFQDYMPGACFDDVFGIGQGVQAAATAATTAAQMAMEKNAMDKAARTGAGQASAIASSGQAAQGYLNPYVAVGQNVLGGIQNNMPLWGNIDNTYTDQAGNQLNRLQNGLTEDYLKQTPGYQFNLSQGEQAVTNSAAARGLANSGAAQKGAASYASGLADSTYQNQYNDTLGTANALLGVNGANQGNITNTWNRENQLLGYGANAAGASATNATNTASLSAQAALGGVGASMAGTTAMANSLTNGLTGLGNQAGNYALYNKLLNGGSSYSPFGGSGVDAG